MCGVVSTTEVQTVRRAERLYASAVDVVASGPRHRPTIHTAAYAWAKYRRCIRLFPKTCFCPSIRPSLHLGRVRLFPLRRSDTPIASHSSPSRTTAKGTRRVRSRGCLRRRRVGARCEAACDLERGTGEHYQPTVSLSKSSPRGAGGASARRAVHVARGMQR